MPQKLADLEGFYLMLSAARHAIVPGLAPWVERNIEHCLNHVANKIATSVNPKTMADVRDFGGWCNDWRDDARLQIALAEIVLLKWPEVGKEDSAQLRRVAEYGRGDLLAASIETPAELGVWLRAWTEDWEA